MSRRSGIAACITITAALQLALAGPTVAQQRSDSYVEQADAIAVQQPGPHEGTGATLNTGGQSLAVGIL